MAAGAHRSAAGLARAVAEMVVGAPRFATAPLIRRWHLRWGATDAEVTAPMPGDDLVAQPSFNATRAITINAPPEAVWPWIVQLGFGRAGWYSYDLFDNAGRPSAERILPEYQHPKEGDWVPMASKVNETTAFKITGLEPDRWMLWEKQHSTWAWKLIPFDGGRTRLISRLKERYEWRATPGDALLTLILFEFGDFPMMRKFLLGVKRRAEQLAARAEKVDGGAVRAGSARIDHGFAPAIKALRPRFRLLPDVTRIRDGDRLDERWWPNVVSPSISGIDLYWLPLGAGGHSVRLNGRVFEALAAWLERRDRCDLYHSALEVRVPEGRFVIEQAPIRPSDGSERGVVAEGAVGARAAGRFRLFRYEIRRWRDGVIPDIGEAVESPHRLSDDLNCAQRLLELAPQVPAPVWGRDELRAGEMWNSNSLISWLIARSGLDVDSIQPPVGGRAPGWRAGIVVARRQQAQAAHPRRTAESRNDGERELVRIAEP